MGKREDYTTCMRPYMTGGGPDRKERFCLGAKLCSGKANNEQEAIKLCAEAATNPKLPKARKSRKCAIDTNVIAACVITSLSGSEPTLANLTPIIASCTEQKVPPNTREKFIKKCFRKKQVTGDIKEAQKLRSFCIAQWKEQEAPL